MDPRQTRQTRQLQGFLAIAEAARLDLEAAIPGVGRIIAARSRAGDIDDAELPSDLRNLHTLAVFFARIISATAGVDADPADVATLRASSPPCPAGADARARAEWPLPLVVHRLLVGLDLLNAHNRRGGTPATVAAAVALEPVLSLIEGELAVSEIDSDIAERLFGELLDGDDAGDDGGDEDIDQAADLGDEADADRDTDQDGGPAAVVGAAGRAGDDGGAAEPVVVEAAPGANWDGPRARWREWL